MVQSPWIMLSLFILNQSVVAAGAAGLIFGLQQYNPRHKALISEISSRKNKCSFSVITVKNFIF